MSRTQLNR